MTRTLLLLVLCAAPSWAGKRLVMEATISGSKERVEMLIEPTRLRTNIGGFPSMIFLADGGRTRIVTLTRGNTEYWEIDHEYFGKLQAMLDATLAKVPAELRDQVKEQMRTPATPSTQAAPKFVASGERAVKGFPCKVYAEMQGDQKVREMCVARAADLGLSAADAGVFELMRKFTEELMKGLEQLSLPGAGGLLDNYLNSVADVPDGQVVQTIAYENGRVSSEDVILSVEDAVFTDTDFSVGAAVKKEPFQLPQ